MSNSATEAALVKTDTTFDLDSLSIEELATLRDLAIDKLAEKVATRQAELEAELERLSQYGKPVKKAAAPTARMKKDETLRSVDDDAVPQAA